MAPSITHLRNAELFSQLPDEVLSEIAVLLETVRLDPDTTVFDKGDTGTSLYLLAAGRVRVHDLDRTLDELGPGQVFGEMALLEGEARSASITTLESSLLYRLEIDAFFGLLERRPLIYRQLVRMLSARLRARMRDIAEDQLYIARLYQASHEQERLTQELRLAAEVQAGFLPQSLPELPGWELSASWEPAREVSGDFYDLTHHQEALDIVVADVADKGMPAALFMALTRSTLRSSLSTAADLARGVEAANRQLSSDAVDGIFVTLFLARFDPEAGQLSYVNAGHNPALLVRADGETSWLGRTGLVLGWDPDTSFEARTLQLEPGDTLVLYTDGVTETTSPEGELFGEDRLEACMTDHALPAEELLACLKDRLEAFSGPGPLDDDRTMVVLRRRPVAGW